VRSSASLATIVPLASGTVTIADLLDVLLTYPAGTVAYYDFAGTGRLQTSTATHVTLDDLGRVTLMNPKISGADAARLLALRLDPALWAAVPRDADLADADPTVHNGLYDAAASSTTHTGLSGCETPRSARSCKSSGRRSTRCSTVSSARCTASGLSMRPAKPTSHGGVTSAATGAQCVPTCWRGAQPTPSPRCGRTWTAPTDTAGPSSPTSGYWTSPRGPTARARRPRRRAAAGEHHRCSEMQRAARTLWVPLGLLASDRVMVQQA